MLIILVISIWFGVWLANYIRFNWIICGFFILTKFLAYTFFFENISPSLIFVMQKHPNFKRFSPEKFEYFLCSAGASRRCRQNWNACIIIYYYYFGFIYYYYCYYYSLLLIFRILYCAPLGKKKKEKRPHYLRCGNSLLTHRNKSMFNTA